MGAANGGRGGAATTYERRAWAFWAHAMEGGEEWPPLRRNSYQSRTPRATKKKIQEKDEPPPDPTGEGMVAQRNTKR